MSTGRPGISVVLGVADDGQPVVVKRASSPGGASLLRAEAARLEAARHRGVVRVVRFTDGEPVELQLAYAGGRTLADVASAGGGRDATLVAASLAELASTLADLHDRGVVHGRLAADHVVVGAAGALALCGWSPPDREATPADDVAAIGELLTLLLHGADGSAAPGLRRLAASATGPIAGRPSMAVLSAALREAAPGAPASAGVVTRRIRHPRSRRLAAVRRGSQRRGADAGPGPVRRARRRPARPQARLPLLGERRRGTGAGRPAAAPAPAATGRRRRARRTTGPASVSRPAGAGAARPVAGLVVAASLVVVGLTVGAAPWGAAPSPSTTASTSAGAGSTTASSTPAPPVRPSACATEHGRRCGGAEVVGAAVERSGTRWLVGRPDDVVLLGDWDCDGAPTAAALRPATGELFSFAGWGEERVAAFERLGPADGARTVDADGDGCDEIEVTAGTSRRVVTPP